jgi:hypothetical protein
VTFDDVASNMGLASAIEVDLDGAEDDSPEAPGVD